MDVYEEHMIRYRLDKERQDNWHNAAYHLAKIASRVAERGRWTDPYPFYRDGDTVGSVTLALISTYNVKKKLTSRTGLWASPAIEKMDNISNCNLPKWSIKEK